MAEMEKEQFKFPDEQETKGKPLEAAGEDDVEYVIEDDTPPEDRGQKPMPKEIVEKLEAADEEEEDLDPKSQKERIHQYKKVWNDERRAKEAAERERQAAFEALQRLNEENKKLRAQYSAGEKTYIETVQSAADTELAMAKREYKEALESGEADRIVEAQAKVSEATFKAQQAKQFKPSALQEQENEVQIPQQSQQRPPKDAKAESWRENNTWFGQDEEMTSLALGVHEKLVKENGMAYATTDEYYKRIDATMRKRFPEYFNEEVEVETKKPSNVVAPATRSTSSKRIKLKQSQVNLAKKLGLTPEQYAQELIKGGQ